MAKKAKSKPKEKPQPREDFIEASHRVMQEVIRRSGETQSAPSKPSRDSNA